LRYAACRIADRRCPSSRNRASARKAGVNPLEQLDVVGDVGAHQFDV
jgi:hypothetical protein